MSRPPIALPLIIVAAATLVAIPAATGGDAHAARDDPHMFAVWDGQLSVFHPNGTFAFDSSIRPGSDFDIGPDGRIVGSGGVYCNHISVFHPNGTHDFCIGDLGHGPGQFDSLRSIAVGPDGRIAATDEGNNRVQVFHPNGTLVFAFGARDSDQLPGPYGVDIGPDGRVYVAHVAPNHTHINVTALHPNGTLDFRSQLSAWAGIVTVAVGPDGRIAMLGDDSVGVFHPNGTLDFVIGSQGYGPGQFNEPTDIAIHPDGRIAVLDRSDDRAQVFYPNGTLAFSIGMLGSGPGQFHYPLAIAVGPAQLLGPPPGSPAPPANGTAPALVAIPAATGGDAHAARDDPHMFAVWDGQLSVFHPNGTFAFDSSIRPGSDFDIGPDGRIVGSGGVYCNHISVFHPNGTHDFCIGDLGHGPGQFDSLRSIAVGPDGRIAATDEGNNRVQVFHPNGTLVFAFGARDSDQLPGPYGVDIGPDGRVYVAHVAPNHTHINVTALHPNGTLDFRSQLSAWAGIVTVAVGPDGRIAMLGDDSVGVFHPNGTLDFVIGSQGYGPGQFNEPTDIAIHPDGRIAVLDRSDDRAQVFYPNGTLAFSIGMLGSGPGQFHYPLAIAVGPAHLLGQPPGSPAPPANGTAPAPPANGTAPAPVTVVIEPGAPAGPLNFTGAGHAANLTIDVAGLAGPGGPPLDGSATSVVTFPPAETSVAASFATVTFPPSVTATHVPAGGRLALRVVEDVPDDAQVQGALAYEGSGRVTLQRVVEVGAESGRVVFDMPVRILLEVQAGGRAFYIEGGADGGTITPIDLACAADDTGRVHRHLGGAGECQMDSTGGDKIIYTYHLTRFGTAQPERAAPPPAVHTCSVAIGMPDMAVSVRPGEHSAPVRQVVVNSGSLRFAGVELAATPWIMNQSAAGPLAADPPPAPPAPVFGTDTGRTASVNTATLVASLPASATEVSTDAAGGAYRPLAAGMSVAGGLEGGAELPLWFRLNLSPHDGLRAGTLVQTVTYQAVCGAP